MKLVKKETERNKKDSQQFNQSINELRIKLNLLTKDQATIKLINQPSNPVAVTNITACDEPALWV